jgi:hypothetical protein
MQDRWGQTLQSSHHMPSHDQVTGRSHSPHGFMVLFLGPGLISMSPHSNKMVHNITLFFVDTCVSRGWWCVDLSYLIEASVIFRFAVICSLRLWVFGLIECLLNINTNTKMSWGVLISLGFILLCSIVWKAHSDYCVVKRVKSTLTNAAV